MKHNLWLALILAWAGTAQAAPEDLDKGGRGERLWIEDGGFERQFVVALDELSVTEPEGRRAPRTVTAVRSLADIRQRAVQLEGDTGQEVELVLYEAGRARNAYTRRTLTRQVLVRLAPGGDAQALAAAVGAAKPESFDYAPDLYLFSATGPGGALDLAERLRVQPGVEAANPMLARLRRKKWMPNDTLFSQQWHLRNTGQGGGAPGIDVNITSAWASYRGSNVLIGIVDDGIEMNHTDLWQNVSTTLGWNWNGNNADFNPVPGNGDYHGTACAGVAAARGNNGRGVSGAAPYATLVGYRLIGGETTDETEASAMLTNNAVVHIKSSSWGPDDDGMTLEGPGPLTLAALSNAATTGRGGRGTILVWAGGNGLAYEDNSNYDGYANSIYTIAIGAITDGGVQAWYSEPGANLVVTAPSGGGASAIVTTDLMGNSGYNYAGAPGELADRDYTQTFTGTSSSAPLVAGIVALMLEANPDLGWRDVQEILIRSATQNHAGDAGWRTNAAGLTFNHKYGAGLVNASAAVEWAETWTNLGPQIRSAVIQTNLHRAIPDNTPAGITQSFVVASAQNLRVEHVTVTVDIQHTYRGDLAITLVSPSGMESQLAEDHDDGGHHYPAWTFSSVRHWGEEAEGTWNLKVADLWEDEVGTMQWARVDFYGTALENGGGSPGTPPTVNPIGPRAVIVGQTLEVLVTATEPDGDPVTFACDTAVNPARWSFDTQTGAFAFTPATNELGAVQFTFTATDKDGTSAPEVMDVSVLAPQRIQSIQSPAGGAPSLVFIQSQAGVTYALQYVTNLLDNPLLWQTVDEATGLGGALGLEDAAPDGPIRFYRVVLP